MATPDFIVLAKGLTETNRVLQELTDVQQSVSGEIVKFQNIPGVEQGVQLNNIQTVLNQLVREIQGLREDNEGLTQGLGGVRQGLEEVRQGLGDVRQDIQEMLSVGAARDRNVYARLENKSASQADFSLSSLYSISLEQAYLQQLNHPIPNFPATVRVLKRLSRNRSIAILGALDVPLPLAQEDAPTLRKRVAKAIGIVRDIFD